MDQSLKLIYSGQGARPKSSIDVSRDVSSDDSNSHISDEFSHSKKVKVQNGYEICQEVKVQNEDDHNHQLKSDRAKASSSNVDTNHSSKGQHDKDSGYGDWLNHVLEVKGDINKGHQVAEPECADILCHEVKGRVIDSGFEDVDASVFYSRRNNTDTSMENISVSDEFLRGINTVCQNKHFDDHEQFLLKKWRESGLKLWKILHEREVCSKKRSKSQGNSEKSSNEDSHEKVITSQSCKSILDCKMCSLEELAYRQAIGCTANHVSKNAEENLHVIGSSWDKGHPIPIGRNPEISNHFKSAVDKGDGSNNNHTDSEVGDSVRSDPQDTKTSSLTHNSPVLDPRETAVLTLESTPEFWTLTDKEHVLDSTEGELVKKSRFMERFNIQSSREPDNPDECLLDLSGHNAILDLSDIVEISDLKEEKYPQHKDKSSPTDLSSFDVIMDIHSKLWKDSVPTERKAVSKPDDSKHSPAKSSDSFPHIPFFCSGPDSCCTDRVWREPGIDIEQKIEKQVQNQNSDKPSHSNSGTPQNITDSKFSGKIGDGKPVGNSVRFHSAVEENWKEQGAISPLHMRRWSNIVGGDNMHSKRTHSDNHPQSQLDDEDNYSDSYEDSIDLEFTDNSRPIVQISLQADSKPPSAPSNSQCNFKDHLLKALDQHKSPIFSSDSATTDLDRSSTNDWADADSSDAYISISNRHEQSKRNSCPDPGYSRDSCMSKSCARFSPKRYRKKTHSRSRSMEHEVVMDLIRNRVIVGHRIDSDSTEESSVGDVKTALIAKDQGHKTACKAPTLQSEISEHFNDLDTDNRDHTENHTVDSCSESSQSADSHCYTGCGPATGILGLRYAIPYLSERLKMSLAKRIESGKSQEQISGKQRSQSQGDSFIEGNEPGFQSDPGCSTHTLKVFNDLNQCGECSLKTVEHRLFRNVSNMSDTNALQASDREEVIGKLWGLEDSKSGSQHSNLSNNIPNKLQNQGPYFQGQGHVVVKDRYLKGKCVCPVSNDEGSHDEISQTDESEGLEISHSFQYIDISDNDMDTFSHSQLQTDLVLDQGSRPSTASVTYDDICKSLQSHINLTNKSHPTQHGYVPLGELSQSLPQPGEVTTSQLNSVSHLSYLPCVELSDSSHLPCKNELSEPLNQINYLPCEEISESLKLIGQHEDTENCSCAETGFLSADGLDLEDVEECRTDLQFLSIEQDTSDCSSIRSDTDRSNLSEEVPVQSLFSTHSESDSGEADDEFECECEHCLQLRTRNDSTLRSQGQGHAHPSSSDLSVVEDEAHGHQRLPEGELEEGLYRISIAELSPLSSIMNSRRNELEVMFENVILQMLAVHPDLLSDATPPPADQSIIDSLPSLTVNQCHLAISLSCPICLCVCEEKETLSCLPCQHLFHQLCIQAWLIK
ncbi:uncharacterized protein LOC110452935 isoform X2 [Mizuhopecten yessoensis]|nr:uncharacterized protein LOC110452935 isoform X2 [Mizuhopecten yessoensis]